MLNVAILSKVSTEIAPTDQMWSPDAASHYFAVGLSGLHAIWQAVAARGAFMGCEPVSDILDFGCGCGRVTRFLRAEYPFARIWVTDLRKDDEAWVVRCLRCEALPGSEPPKELFDLIFLGSVVTHLPQDAARDLLALALAGLRTGGILVFTTQGRGPYRRLCNIDWELARRYPWMSYNLSPAQVGELLATYRDTGYGYVNYTGQVDYGVAIAPAHWYFAAVVELADVTQVVHWERGFDDHQDVLAFFKRPIGSDRSEVFISEVIKALGKG